MWSWSRLDQLDGGGGAEISGIANLIVEVRLGVLAEDMDVSVVADFEDLRAGLRAPTGGGAKVEVDGDAHAPTLSGARARHPRAQPRRCRSKAESTARSEAVVMFGSVPMPQRTSLPEELST